MDAAAETLVAAVDAGKAPPPDTSHWDEARKGKKAAKAPVPSPAPKPAAYNAEEVQKAKNGIFHMGTWCMIPGGEKFWNALYAYLDNLETYARGQGPSHPVPPNILRDLIPVASAEDE